MRGRQVPVYSDAPKTDPYDTPPIAQWTTAQVPPAVVQISPA